jgi:hypothetical protein
VGGADRDAEPGRYLDQSVVLAQVHQSDERALVRRELAAAVTLAGDELLPVKTPRPASSTQFRAMIT